MFISACWDSDSYSLLSERSARLFYPCGCCLNPAGWFSDHSSRLSNNCAGSQVAVTKTYPAGFQIIQADYQIVINPSSTADIRKKTWAPLTNWWQRFFYIFMSQKSCILWWKKVANEFLIISPISSWLKPGYANALYATCKNQNNLHFLYFILYFITKISCNM